MKNVQEGDSNFGTSPHGSSSELVVDRDTFTIRWRDRSCFLGNRMPFRLIERLARARGTFLPISRLLDEVWDGRDVNKETVSKTASNLRAKLREAGMADHVIIDGAEPDHFRLILR